MKPIGKNIIIKTIEEELKTSSGLLLSSDDASQLRYKKGVVIKSGTQVEAIHESDLVFYDKRAGFTLIIKDEPFTVIQEKDVVVVL
jgi:co-chaperonin GroES (HSP10)|tara:strand:- start:695 stop:952 length:258 start_codon:yes stop_codon:yes gene_type:complete